MPNRNDEILGELKELPVSEFTASLAIVKEYKVQRESRYEIRYIPITSALEERLKSIIESTIRRSGTVEDYSFDCPEPEDDQVRAIDSTETDFHTIHTRLSELNPEQDVINGIEELVRAKAYLIVLRDVDGIRLIAFKTLPESWRMRQTKGLIPLLYKDNRFDDLESDNVFSISPNVDLLAYDGMLFILSKRDFERGLNFRDGMITRALELYEEMRTLDLFRNLDILESRVGNNMRYLRKISTIKNLGYYRDGRFLEKMKTVVEQRNWGIGYEDHQIVITQETLDDILTLLQDKRLRSEITEKDFDVDHAKPLESE